MPITNRIHRDSAVAAGIFMLLLTVLSIGLDIYSASLFHNSTTSTLTIIGVVITAIINGMLAFVLFRGKKDPLAGALALVSMLTLMAPTLVRWLMLGQTPLVLEYFVSDFASEGLGYYVAADLIGLAAGLFGAFFRILLAVECFKPGCVSGKKARSLLVFLPVVSIFLAAVATMVENLYPVRGSGFGVYVTSVFLPALILVIVDLAYVLMGLAFSIPVYEQNPDMQDDYYHN